MPIDTRYRLYPAETIAALIASTLTQIKQIEGVGQSHSINGRSTSQATLRDLHDTLANLYAAQKFQSSSEDAGNAGYVSRFTDFSRQPTDVYPQ